VKWTLRFTLQYNPIPPSCQAIELELYEELEKSIRQIHPYEVSEILAIPVIVGSKDYLGWLGGVVKER